MSAAGAKIAVPRWWVRLFRPFHARKMMDRIEGLKHPRLITLPAVQVLAVTMRGNPNETAGRAFGALYRARFKIRGIGRKIEQAPRARFPVDGLTGELAGLTGEYALPVPASVRELPPAAKNIGGIGVELKAWKYGEVAEILHVGPYSEEASTIAALQQFIGAQGYRITGGVHEEEYYAGPGKVKIDPADFLTFIRYRVERR